MFSNFSGMSNSMYIAEECLKSDRNTAQPESAQSTDGAEVLAQTIDLGEILVCMQISHYSVYFLQKINKFHYSIYIVYWMLICAFWVYSSFQSQRNSD